MSGSYTRKLYDECNYKLDTKESVGPGNYRFFVGFHENELNNKYCKKNQGSTIPNTWSAVGQRTDIESKLMVLTKNTNLPHKLLQNFFVVYN